MQPYHIIAYFVEGMWRCRYIALNTGIGAGAEEILIPEEKGLERLLESLSRSEKSENPQV